MRAGEASCSCPQCGVVCEGRYNGCSDVWARGPQPVGLISADALASAPSENRSTTRPLTPLPPSGPAAPAIAVVGSGASPAIGLPAPTPAQLGAALAELRSELRTVVDRLSSQQATMGEWRAAIDAQVAQLSTLAAVPQQLAETARELHAHNESVQRNAEEIRSNVDVALAAARHEIAGEVAGRMEWFQRELADAREAQLRSLHSAVAAVMAPLVEEWSQTRAEVARVAAKLASLPATLSNELAETVETQAGHLTARLEDGQREIAKLQQELLMTRLETMATHQRGVLETVEATLASGMEQARLDQNTRMRELEANLSSAVRTLVNETVVHNVEELPEVLLGAFREMSEENTRALVSRVDEIAARNRRELAELNRVVSAEQQEVARLVAASGERAAAENERASQALTDAQQSTVRRLQAIEAERVERVAELEKLCERMARRLADSRRRQERSVEVEALDARIAEFTEQLEALHKLARSIERKAVPAAGSAASRSKTAAPARAASRGTRR